VDILPDECFGCRGDWYCYLIIVTNSFSGTNGLTLGAGTCTYTVTVGTGEARTITASGRAGTIIRKTSVSITAINPLIVVSSWQEVP